MGFSIDTHSLPAIRDYAAAVRHHDSIMPIRGKTIRPLINGRAGRRKQHMQIIKQVDAVVCRLYNTDCVTYHANGHVTVDFGGWYTQSTYKFITSIVPWVRHIKSVPHQGVIVRCAVTHPHAPTDYAVYRADPTLTFDADRKVVDPEPFIVHTLDRGLMRDVRKQYKAFMQYAIGVGRLTEWGELEGMREWNIANMHDSEAATCMQSDDPEAWMRAVKYVCANNGRTYWGWKNGTWANHWFYSESKFKNAMAGIIMRHHSDYVLRREALPIGVYRKDIHAKHARE